MIRTLHLKFGRATGAAALSVDATPITVFVGPNNSGKSKLLQEINAFCDSGRKNTTDVLLEHLDFCGFRAEHIDGVIARIALPPVAGESLMPGSILVGRRGNRQPASLEALSQCLQEPFRNTVVFCRWYLRDNTLMLDGKSRMSLVQQQRAGDLKQPVGTTFQVLFSDDEKRAEVRRIIHDAFGLYLVVDPTNLGHLRLALSDRAPSDSMEERGIHHEAVAFHSKALPIEQASDGVKAFTGIISEITAGDPQVVLIDEPEAFLHPALSFKLGKEISVAADKADKRVLVSTHSPNFVMGCIQSNAPVNIIRLTYRQGVATARILRNDDLLRLMRNPLLRSTGVIGALFYEFVVITESDADRAFYQEINERLLRWNPERAVPNCLFLNAQNKQTVRMILKPLRELGIPAAAIVDIDVLKDGGQTWTSFLDAGYIPTLEHQSLGAMRQAVKEKLEATERCMKRDGGVNLLNDGEREAAENLLDKLSLYGLFVVRTGELESWLRHLSVGNHGPQWLIEVFQKMGEDPDSPGYLKPADGDVWAFMGEVKKWLTDPKRKGIPA